MTVILDNKLTVNVADARYVNIDGDTMTAPLTITLTPSTSTTALTANGAVKINPADGTADPLFSVVTTGTNEYGFNVNTWDLSLFGYGKFPVLCAESNSPLGNLFLTSGFLVGNVSCGSSVLGQTFGFIDENTLTSLLVTAQWDYDSLGLGNNRMSFNDDLYVDGNVEVSGALIGTLSPDNLSIGNNTQNQPKITFDALNYDGYLYFNDSADSQPVGYYFGNAGLTGKGIATPIIKMGGSRLIAGSDSNIFIDLSYSNDYRIYYSGYLTGGENAGATAHYFTALGSNLPADGWFMRGFNMNDPGHIFGITKWGDLEIGSSDTSTDHDTYLKFKGKDNTYSITFDQSDGGALTFAGKADTDLTFNFTGTTNSGQFLWMEDEDYFKFSDDVLMNSTERIYFRDTDISIYSANDGYLDIVADTGIRLNKDTKITGDLEITKELKGCRRTLTAGKQGNQTADAYLTIGIGGTLLMSSTVGYVQNRAGSIVGYAINLNVSAQTTAGDVKFEIRKNDVAVWSKTIAINGTGNYTAYDTVARGTYTFAAGDKIQMYLDFVDFVGTISNSVMEVEIVVNT